MLYFLKDRLRSYSSSLLLPFHYWKLSPNRTRDTSIYSQRSITFTVRLTCHKTARHRSSRSPTTARLYVPLPPPRRPPARTRCRLSACAAPPTCWAWSSAGRPPAAWRDPSSFRRTIFGSSGPPWRSRASIRPVFGTGAGRRRTCFGTRPAASRSRALPRSTSSSRRNSTISVPVSLSRGSSRLSRTLSGGENLWPWRPIWTRGWFSRRT